MSQASTMGSTVLDSRASNSKAITRLLQHSILQLCNEHIGYSHKLQILGVLCMTVDDEQQELVVKVNNTLKRVSPQGPKEAAPPPQVQGMMPGAGYPPPEIQLPHPAVPQSIYNISSPVGSQSNGQQGASGSGQPTPHSTPVAAAAGDASEPAHEAEGSSTPLSTSYSDSPSNGQIASGTGSGNTNKRSHGRKGTKPTKVHHVYDEGEMIDEGDGDILTVIPTDPDNPDEGIQMTPLPPPQPVSVYPDDDDSAEEVCLETPPRRRKPRRFSTPKGPIATASPNVRALLQQSIANRAAAPQGEGNQLRNALLNGAQSTLTMPLCLPTQMPERVASTASSSEPMDMSTSQFNGDLDDEDRESGSLQIDESGNDDIEQARGDSDSFRLNSSVVSVKDEPKDDYNWSQAGQVFNTTNSLNASGLSLANGAALSAFQSGNYAGYTLAPHLDGMASLPNYSGLSLALGSPNYQLPSTSNQQDGLTIRYTPTGPITVGANGKNVSQQKVKDIIMFDDQSPLSQQKGNRLETDYMVDKMGMEGRKRRRRAPDETLTSEEIAEYMGASAGADAQVGKGTFQCKYCTVRVEDLVTYMQHTLAIHNAFICHQCGKSFTTKSSLLRHRPIHTGMRRFACSICKKTFYRKDKCKAHIKRHLGNNGEIASEIIEREIE